MVYESCPAVLRGNGGALCGVGDNFCVLWAKRHQCGARPATHRSGAAKHRGVYLAGGAAGIDQQECGAPQNGVVAMDGAWAHATVDSAGCACLHRGAACHELYSGLEPEPALAACS